MLRLLSDNPKSQEPARTFALHPKHAKGKLAIACHLLEYPIKKPTVYDYELTVRVRDTRNGVNLLRYVLQRRTYRTNENH